MSPPPGRIIDIYVEDDNRIGLVEFGGKRRAIYLSLVPEAQLGDYVRFHAGFATERIPPENVPPGVASAESEKGEPVPDLGHGYRLLRDLDPNQLRKLIPLVHEKHFDSGEIIFHIGEQSSFLHLIVSGDVALEQTTGGEPVQVQVLHAGDAMGWSALTPGDRTHLQARALSRTSTISFAGDEIRAACDRDPALGYALTKRLMELVVARFDAVRIQLANHMAEHLAGQSRLQPVLSSEALPESHQ